MPRLEQEMVYLESASISNINEVVKKWNANGWRAISMLSTTGISRGNSYILILFERYVQ